MTLTEAIVELLSPAGPGVTVQAGGGLIQYPYITISVFDPVAIAEPRGGAVVVEIPFQTTAVALDASEAEAIGAEAWHKLQEATDGGGPPLAWDRGLPGREMARTVGEPRLREQPNAGPDGRSIYYYHFDTTLMVQRQKRRPVGI